MRIGSESKSNIDYLEENLGIFRDDPQLELCLVDHRLNLEESNRAADTRNPLEAIWRNAFNSQNRMRLIELNDHLPIVRRPKGKPELDSVSAVAL